MFLVLVRSDSIRHRLAEYLHKVQMYMHEKISIYRPTCTWFDKSTQPLLAFHWNEVAIQSKVSNQSSVGDISPRLSYCNHYALCNVSLSFRSLSNLRVIKFWRTCSFCFLLRWDALSGFSRCHFISIHWAELWYWRLLTCCWPQYLAWFLDVFFFKKFFCDVLCFGF